MTPLTKAQQAVLKQLDLREFRPSRAIHEARGESSFGGTRRILHSLLDSGCAALDPSECFGFRLTEVGRQALGQIRDDEADARDRGESLQ